MNVGGENVRTETVYLGMDLILKANMPPLERKQLGSVDD